MSSSLISKAYIVPGLPHILLAPDQSPGWARLHEAYQLLRKDIEQQDADLILYFSTQWLSILGYMLQADPAPEWVHVDQQWHTLGSIPYQFTIDTDMAAAYADEINQLGYKSRLINYRGFPIDTGTIVAQKLLNPNNRLPAAIVSCNMYSEKEETTRLGQAAARALQTLGKKAVVVLVSNLSHRFHVKAIDPKQDRISSLKDDEWNRKALELLAAGAVEDLAQCVREFARQANGDQKLKGLWWLNGLLGQSNNFKGEVLAYEAVWGTGAALVALEPTEAIQASPRTSTSSSEEGSQAALVDELTDFEARSAPPYTAKLSPALPARENKLAQNPKISPLPDFEIVSPGSPEAVGAYPHARRYGDVLFLSGIGPRQLGSKEIPGITFDEHRRVIAYDIRVQTRAVIANLKRILEDAGSSLEKIIDVQVFLTNMAADFSAYNEVYNETFQHIRPTRTTVEVGALPTPIAVEFKVIARP